MKKVFFIGQAPPRTDPVRPFGRTKLYNWLDSIGVTEADLKISFNFGALVDFFPGSKNGSHLLPDQKQIAEFAPKLRAEILEFNPHIIVPVGKLSLQYCLGLEKNLKLDDYIGRKFEHSPYGLKDKKIIIIPFPHPSGASSWVYKPANKKLLDAALELLKKNLK